MQQLPTYEQQFNKITEAYIKGDIQPYDSEFCFCGTLDPHKEMSWNYDLDSNNNYRKPQPYTYQQYKKMEMGLLDAIRLTDKYRGDYEDCLFNGMCAALEVLKEIHIQRGEVIDAPPQFQKRQLINA